MKRTCQNLIGWKTSINFGGLYLLRLLMASILVLFVCGVSDAQTKAEKEVARAVVMLTKAMTAPDSSALSQITADELSYGHSHGLVQTKKQFIHSIISGESDFVTINISDQTIVVSGKTAIVRHKLSAQTNDRGKPGHVDLYILLVWQKRHGSWILLARQAIPFTANQ